MQPNESCPAPGRWYTGIGRYQWLVLVIACAGWVFDVYESQIFNITRADVLNELLAGDETQVKMVGDWFLAVFLVGGTLGGLLFGSLADRFGRGPIMIITILIYSLFSGMTYFVANVWQLVILRLLVSIGLGGEWAVAAALVAEVFPARARSQASAIFHGSSVLGTWLAALAGILVGSHWRYAYLLGVLPALLVVWVRASIREPKNWQERRATIDSKRLGSLRELFSDPKWNRRALFGMLLAAVGLGTFWAVTVAGQGLAYERAIAAGVSEKEATTASRFAYGIVQATGLGIGLLAFGPIAAWLGRKPAFALFHALALVIVPVTCFLPQSYFQLLLVLPFYGFFTAGMHSGYAVYFPELFPTHLRATGTSFCFNGGRLAAVPVLIFSGWLKQIPALDLRFAVTGLALLYLLGILLLLFLPETNRQELPD
ncbi:MAG: MFS transporter [Planctomycetales bacterium]|nr:MFS transporter [Planctomycetales bacterium]